MANDSLSTIGNVKTAYDIGGALASGVGLGGVLAGGVGGLVAGKVLGGIMGSKPPQMWFNTYSGNQMEGGNPINNELVEAYSGLNPQYAGHLANIDLRDANRQTITDGMGYDRTFNPIEAPGQLGNIGNYLQQRKFDEYQQFKEGERGGANIGDIVSNRNNQELLNREQHTGVMDDLGERGLWSFQNRGDKAQNYFGDPFATSTGAFGDYSLSNKKDKLIDQQFADKWVGGITDMDNQVASYLTPEQINQVSQGLGGSWQSSEKWDADESARHSTDNMILDRYHAIFDMIGREDLSQLLRDSKDPAADLAAIMQQGF